MPLAPEHAEASLASDLPDQQSRAVARSRLVFSEVCKSNSVWPQTFKAVHHCRNLLQCRFAPSSAGRKLAAARLAFFRASPIHSSNLCLTPTRPSYSYGYKNSSMTSSYTTWHRLAPPLLLIYLLLLSNTWVLQTTAQLTKGNRKAPQDLVTAYTPSYRPINVTCPPRSLLRNAGTVAGRDQTINPDEAVYVENRRITEVADAFENYLAKIHTGYDLRKLAPNASYCR